MQVGFPKTVELSYGDTDDICRFCGMWCTFNTTCGIRYHKAWGYWVENDKNIEHAAQSSTSEIEQESIPICDKCFNIHAYNGAIESLQIMNKTFNLDNFHRVND